METTNIKPRSWGLVTVYIANLLLAFHWYTILYVNSPFISNFIGESRVSLIYTIGSVLNLLLFIFAPLILQKIGGYKFITIAILLESLATIGLATIEAPTAVILLFILHQTVVPMILFSLDIFLEAFSTDESKTGSIRGLFLTLANIALIISPALASLVINNGDFFRVYLLSSLFLIPLLILTRAWKNTKDYPTKRVRIKDTFLQIKKDKNVYNIWKVNFMLQLFYAWMVIYLPLYLINSIGFSWSQVGLLLTIMFLPFVIFEMPIGRLADTKYGEKEILSIGFMITGLATILLAFPNNPSFYIWAIILFGTRIGASFVEITTESYFFKHVNAGNTNLISFFRMTRPISFVIAPILAAFILRYTTYGGLFALVGIFMFWGLRYSLTLVDTK